MRRLLTALSIAGLLVLPLLAQGQELRSRDLDALAQRATVAVRGEIVAVSAEGADLHPLAVYAKLGSPVALVRVRAEGERPMRPAPGDRGIYFLVPSAEAPGALSFVQEDSERLPVEAEADAAVDAFMRKLLAPREARAELWLEGLATGSPAIVAHSARKLAALARQGALASADWDRLLSFLSSDKAGDEAKAGVVAALGGELPSDRTLALLSQAPEGSRLKSALVASLAQRGPAGGAAQEKARKAIGVAAQDASPEVVLAAAQGLAALGDESALPELDRALKASDAAARQAAVESLAKLALQGSRRARSRLQSLFDDADGLVRARARNAWADAYLSDPMRVQRTRASLWFVGIALALLVAVAVHGWIDRRRV